LDVLEAVRYRRSIRNYTDETVSEKDVETLLDSARYAPSAGNIQPWEFVVVRSTERKGKLSEGALNQNFIQNASVVIVVCAEINRSNMRNGHRRETFYSIQDTAAATQNIHLTAQKLGLATCWVGAFNNQEIAKAVNAPKNIMPVAIIPIGFTSSRPMPPKRRPLNEIVHVEKF
jgi:nitroreductase